MPDAVPFDQTFYDRPTLEVARDLIGALLVHETPHGRLSGYIVETEAYRAPDDAASHAYRGETPRNRVMFGPAGRAYVYLSYGMHQMLNVVTERVGLAAAILIRALEPCEGIESMAAHRAPVHGSPASHNIANGPGRLCQAMGIDVRLNGADLAHPPLYILPGRGADLAIVQTTRIGITRSVELPWRFYLLGSPAVSVRHRPSEARQFPAQASASRSKAGPSLHSKA